MTTYPAFERGIQLALRLAGRLQAWRATRRAARIDRGESLETGHFANDRARGSHMSSHPVVVAVAILTCPAYGPGAGSHRGHLRYSN
jgi:hypothetical protein